MAQKLALNICHMYPDEMDTYGDTGNIIAFSKRCQWRDIDVHIQKLVIGKKIKFHEIDFFFFGGGQDKIQSMVGQDLAKHKLNLIKAIDNGAVLLSICGGYQLLQNYFETIDQNKIDGVGIFDSYTVGSPNRMIQNLVIEINPDVPIETTKSNQLVGFENHSGKTYLNGNTKPMGQVITGSGNNGEDKTEGAFYKNAFGCYLHGSLLPKNPHFVDFLIQTAIERKNGKVKLDRLNDDIEWKSHSQSISRSHSPG